MSKGYEEVEKGVYVVRDYEPPKRKVDAKRMKEIIATLVAMLATREREASLRTSSTTR